MYLQTDTFSVDNPASMTSTTAVNLPESMRVQKCKETEYFSFVAIFAIRVKMDYKIRLNRLLTVFII